MRISDWSSDVCSSDLTRADAIIGARFTRTGTGASVARFEASGGGAAVSDNINFLTVKPTTVNISILPTSSAGLSAGDLWNDAGTLKIVSASSPDQPDPTRCIADRFRHAHLRRAARRLPERHGLWRRGCRCTRRHGRPPRPRHGRPAK